MAEDQKNPAGVLSYARSGGQVDDEYLTELKGTQGRRTIRQMTNNSTISGVLFALHNLFRTTEYHVDPAVGDIDPDTAQEYANWTWRTLIELIGDPKDPMGGSWDDLVMMLASALENGWAYVDITRRTLPDGSIGVGQVIQIHPDTLDQWDMEANGSGRVLGLWQYPPQGLTSSLYVSAERAVHFVPVPFKGSPEGRSILRGGYEDWYYRRKLVTFRAILAERMSGFPVVTANSDIKDLANNPDTPEALKTKAAAAVREIEKIAPKIKVNQQAGATLWTKPYVNVDADGNRTHTSTMQLDVKLLTPTGSSVVDYDKAIQYHDTAIARSVLMQFLFMGADGTSGAQNAMVDMNSLFHKAASGWLAAMCRCLSRQLIPMLWKWNGYPEEYMPTMRAGRISSESIEVLGRYVDSLSRAGFVLNDDATEEFLRMEGGLPLRES